MRQSRLIHLSTSTIRAFTTKCNPSFPTSGSLPYRSAIHNCFLPTSHLSGLPSRRSFLSSLPGFRWRTRDYEDRAKKPEPEPPEEFSIESMVRNYAAMQETLATVGGVYNKIAGTAAGRLMRLDRPAGTHLLFLPCAWGIAVGSSSFVHGVWLSALFYAGSTLLRGAGCTINDLWDRDIDRRVARTKMRPLASGEVGPRYAAGLIVAQLFGGLYILTLLNSQCFPIAALSLIPAAFYPLAKQLVRYPQLILGGTFNLGALLGYTAAAATLASPVPFLLYAAANAWTLIYDTIYAFQDVRDDRKIGVQSTAIAFGQYPKAMLAALATSKFALLAAVGPTADLSLPYYMCLSVAASHQARYIAYTDLKDPAQCRAAFESNVTTGTITWAGLVLGRLF